MEYTVHVTYDRAMIGEGARRYCRRPIGWVMPTACLLALISLAGLLSSGDRSWLVGALGAILLGGVGDGRGYLCGERYFAPTSVRTTVAPSPTIELVDLSKPPHLRRFAVAVFAIVMAHGQDRGARHGHFQDH